MQRLCLICSSGLLGITWREILEIQRFSFTRVCWLPEAPAALLKENKVHYTPRAPPASDQHISTVFCSCHCDQTRGRVRRLVEDVFRVRSRFEGFGVFAGQKLRQEVLRHKEKQYAFPPLLCKYFVRAQACCVRLTDVPGRDKGPRFRPRCSLRVCYRKEGWKEFQSRQPNICSITSLNSIIVALVQIRRESFKLFPIVL